MTNMPAKDWAPLRNALWRHVRDPLRRDHPQEWDAVVPGATIAFDRLNSLANGGKISATDERSVVLWYTLVYGCPHFDALSALMAKREFREPVLQAPNTPKKRTARIVARTLLGRHHAHCTLSPRLLHVDFGCGPGTASWAAIRNLSGRVTLVTVGHDHNRHMTKLAKRILRDISDTAHGATYKFFSNWIIFEALAKGWQHDATI